jgi:hypothetical protein
MRAADIRPKHLTILVALMVANRLLALFLLPRPGRILLAGCLELIDVTSILALLTGKEWARRIALTLAALGLLNLCAFAPIPLLMKYRMWQKLLVFSGGVLSFWCLYYLRCPEVRSFFANSQLRQREL